MWTAAFKLVRFNLAVCLLICGFLIAPPTTATPAEMADPVETTVDAEPDELASLPPEVRLRRLHLVRPDLIPYPVAFRSFC